MARTPSSKRTSTPSSWPTLCQAPQGPQRPGALRAHLQSLDDAAKSVQAKSASPNCSCPCPITYRSSFSSRSCRTKSRLIRAINPAMMMARTTAGRRERFANRTSISLIVEIIVFSLMRFLMAGRRKPHQLTTTLRRPLTCHQYWKRDRVRDRSPEADSEVQASQFRGKLRRSRSRPGERRQCPALAASMSFALSLTSHNPFRSTPKSDAACRSIPGLGLRAG